MIKYLLLSLVCVSSLIAQRADIRRAAPVTGANITNAANANQFTTDSAGKLVIKSGALLTNLTAANLTAGSVPYIGTGGLLSEATNTLYLDAVNGRLSVGARNTNLLYKLNVRTLTGDAYVFVSALAGSGDAGIRLNNETDNNFEWIMRRHDDGVFQVVNSGSTIPLSISTTDTVTITGNLTVTKVSATTPTALTYASPTSVNVTLGNVFTATTVNATGSVTFNATAGGTAGQQLIFIITNDATSAKTITFGTNFVPNGTLTPSGVGKVATIEFISNGTSFYELARTVLP